MDNLNNSNSGKAKEEGGDATVNKNVNGNLETNFDMESQAEKLPEKLTDDRGMTKDKIDYGILDVPPVYMCILLGFQV